jgi:hypothetical protein
MLTAPNLRISHHAVQQYRTRAILCCERSRSNETLRQVMADQVQYRSWRCAGGETFVVECGPVVPKAKKPWEYKIASITHTFVIETQTIVTVLGYMMRPNKRAIQRRRRRQRVRALQQFISQEGSHE